MPKPANGRRRCSIKNQRCLVTSGGVSGRGSGGRRRRSKDCQREPRYGFVEGDFFAAFAPAASFLLSQSQLFFPKTSLTFSMNCSVVSCTVGFSNSLCSDRWTGGPRRVNVYERFPQYACGF